ncbi:MAG: serine/threonine-protein phosphatase [Corynebacteriales bacterium]|uniref:PP2C family protein-serine/threonine phosphatase n=1 Tax=uncultured Lawsonella sp. TaxID=1847727 RepID=UPI0025631473|nr:protein phosphatase 2C domain-containing protein [uncultured Lawsonella sp.]MBS6414373.1 serine/threonine-protein phosphatase [Mycobacteriales bacterium]
MTLILKYAARSDMGLVRGNNEDSVYAGPRLLALADGMGGHAAGEVASQLVISAISPLDNDQPGHDLLDEMRRRIDSGNDLIRDAIYENPNLDGMGTTLVAMLFDGPKMAMASVGDSRAYLLRNGELHQITRDDSFVQDLVDEGRITPEEASVHPKRSLITNALMGGECRPHLTIREVAVGDRYLICSDGLSDPVSFSTIATTMAQGTPQECADRLIDLALRSGGPDNVTLIVADVVEDDFGPTHPVLGGAAAKGVDTPANGIRTDSAAVRAANLAAAQRATPTRIEADASGDGSTGDTTSDDDTAGSGGKRKGKRRGMSRSAKKLTAIIVSMVLLCIGILAGVVSYTYNNTYYVGLNDKGEVLIYKGLNKSWITPLSGHPDSVLCESAIYDADSVPADCQHLTLDDFTQALRTELVSDKVFHSQEEARNYLTRAIASGLIPECDPNPIIIYDATGQPVGQKDHPVPCRKAK